MICENFSFATVFALRIFFCSVESMYCSVVCPEATINTVHSYVRLTFSLYVDFTSPFVFIMQQQYLTFASSSINSDNITVIIWTLHEKVDCCEVVFHFHRL